MTISQRTFRLSGITDSDIKQKAAVEAAQCCEALTSTALKVTKSTSHPDSQILMASCPSRNPFYQSARLVTRQGARSRTRLLSGSARKVAAFVTYVSRRLIPVPKRGSKTFFETQARSAELLVGTVLVPGGERMTITDKSYASAQIQNSGASQGS